MLIMDLMISVLLKQKLVCRQLICKSSQGTAEGDWKRVKWRE